MTPHSRGTTCPSLASSIAALEKSEGAGKAGCFAHPQPCVQVKKARKQVTTGPPKHSGLPCAIGFNGLSACSPRCTGLCSHRRLANHHLARLDPSVGRSGPHALAVRCNNTRLLKLHRPSHLVSYVRDDASAPLVSTRRRDIGTD